MRICAVSEKAGHLRVGDDWNATHWRQSSVPSSNSYEKGIGSAVPPEANLRVFLEGHPMRLWYQSTLDFSEHRSYARSLAEHFRKVAGTGTEVILRGRATDGAGSLSAAEIIGSSIVYRSVVDPAFVRAVFEAEALSADAFIAASFSEPILPELRSLAVMPVVSMSEACFAAASASAPKIGLLRLNKDIVPYLEKSISLHKWKDRVSGIHLLEGGISETELDAHYAHPSPFLDRLTRGVRTAATAGAQAVIVAEGVLGMMAAANGLTDVDGIPVIDAIAATVLFARFLVDMKVSTGLMQSRAAYPLPSAAARRLIAVRAAGS
jgi:allantoin racemase